MLRHTGNYTIGNGVYNKLPVPPNKNVDVMIIPNTANAGSLYIATARKGATSNANISESGGVVLSINSVKQEALYIYSDAAAQGYQLMITDILDQQKTRKR